jgi:hypothetical protein
MKSCYEFTGSWLHIFDKLVGIINPSNIQRFAVWEAKSTDKKHLLIVYELRLASDFETGEGINRISEEEFVARYRNTPADHKIHGFNELNRNSNIFTTLFSRN